MIPIEPSVISQAHWVTDGRERTTREAPQPEATPPTWFEKAIQQDADLRSAIPMIDEQPQSDHVVFSELDHKLEPGILFRFMLLNASVYTVEVTTVEGILQMEGAVIPGKWKIAEAQAPVNFPRRRRYNLFLKFVLDTEAARIVVQELVASNPQEIYFDLDHVKVKVQAKEDPSVTGELRFPQQYWRPPAPRGADTLGP